MIGRDDLAGVDDFAAAPGNVAERGTRSQHSRADRFTSRMRKHQRNAQREAPDSPGAASLKHHGWGTVEELRLVPDRIAALLTEAEWTCALAARGVEVFGNWPGDLCPAKVWADPPAWGHNWINPRVPDVTFLVAADDTVRTVYTTWDVADAPASRPIVASVGRSIAIHLVENRPRVASAFDPSVRPAARCLGRPE